MTLDDHLEKDYQDAAEVAEQREKIFKEALYSADDDDIIDIIIDIITEDRSKAKRVFELIDDVFWVDKYKDKIIDEYLKEQL